MRKDLTIFLFFSLLFSACEPYDTVPNNADGYAPIYSNDVASLKAIKAEPARATINGGRMYTVVNLLFQVEQDSGIHIINYANAVSPQKLGFIRSFLCKELAVRNGFIYTNNLSDLVVIDINNPSDIREVGRTTDVFPDLATQYPQKTATNQFERIYFECPDPAKGVVIGWKKQTITKPKCWR